MEEADAELLRLEAERHQNATLLHAELARNAPIHAEWKSACCRWLAENPTAPFNYILSHPIVIAQNAAAEREDILCDAIDAAAEQIRNLPAQTLAGLAVKARLARENFDAIVATPRTLAVEGWEKERILSFFREVERMAKEAAPGAAVLLPSPSLTPDPVFAAIQEHQRAWDVLGEVGCAYDEVARRLGAGLRRRRRSRKSSVCLMLKPNAFGGCWSRFPPPPQGCWPISITSARTPHSARCMSKQTSSLPTARQCGPSSANSNPKGRIEPVRAAPVACASEYPDN